MVPPAELCGLSGDLSLQPATVLCYLALDTVVTLLAAVLLLLAVTVWLTCSTLVRLARERDVRVSWRDFCWTLLRSPPFTVAYLVSVRWRLPAAACVALSGPLLLSAALLSPRRVAEEVAALLALAAAARLCVPAAARAGVARACCCRRRPGLVAPAPGRPGVLNFESAQQRFYQAAVLVARDLYEGRLITEDDVDTVDQKVMTGVPAVVLFRCAVRSAAPRRHGIVMVDGTEWDPSTLSWPKAAEELLKPFYKIRDLMRTLELTEDETMWLERKLVEKGLDDDPPAHFDQQRREDLFLLLKHVCIVAFLLTQTVPAFKRNLEPFIVDLKNSLEGDEPSRLARLSVEIANGKLDVVARIMDLRQDWNDFLLMQAQGGPAGGSGGASDVGVLMALKSRADVNTRTPAGATPLIIAATQGRTEVVRMLLEWRADPALTTKRGATPRMAAEVMCQVADAERRNQFTDVLRILP